MYRTIMVAAISVAALVTLAACGTTGSPQQSARTATELGRVIYARNCQVCHGDAKSGKGAVLNAPIHGPDGHTWHHADGQLSEIILGTFDFPGKTMPPFAEILSDKDVDSVLTYMKSNWGKDQLDWQAEVSQNWLELKRAEGSNDNL